MFWIIQYLKTIGNNFGQVTPRIYRSALPSVERLKHLKEVYGIELVLDLRHDSTIYDVINAKSIGVELIRLPMRDDEFPSTAQVQAVLSWMRSDVVKLINCKGGRHRTGLMVAVYRVVDQGYSKKEAWEEAEKYGWYDANGHKPLREFFEKLDPNEYQA